MVNVLAVSARIVALAWALKPLATKKVSAESVTVVRWELPALVLDPFGVPSEQFCTWRDATPIETVC